MTDSKPGENVGDLKVWNIINPPNKPRWIRAPTPHAAKVLIDGLAEVQLQVPSIESNVFGLVEWNGEEWTEWYSDEGEDTGEWEYEQSD